MTKDRVLQLLEEENFLSGQAISQELGVSRAAVWKAIEQLRAQGYEIEAAPRRGYRLSARPDRITQEGVLHCLGDHPWGAHLTVLETVDSTNTRAKAMAAQGAPHGTVVLSEQQLGGRGRLGRSFYSPPGMGIYLSVILRWDVPPQRLMHLTCTAAEAVRRAILSASGVETEIKWPNDLVWRRKKICGILTELSVVAESGALDYVVCGIGINCGQDEGDFPPEVAEIAASLRQAGGRIDRCTLAAALIRELSAMAQALPDQAAPYLAAYREHCLTLGQDVKVLRAGGESFFARVESMDEEGALQVLRSDGTRETVFSGEVSIRGMYGYST